MSAIDEDDVEISTPSKGRMRNENLRTLLPKGQPVLLCEKVTSNVPLQIPNVFEDCGIRIKNEFSSTSIVPTYPIVKLEPSESLHAAIKLEDSIVNAYANSYLENIKQEVPIKMEGIQYFVSIFSLFIPSQQ